MIIRLQFKKSLISRRATLSQLRLLRMMDGGAANSWTRLEEKRVETFSQAILCVCSRGTIWNQALFSV